MSVIRQRFIVSGTVQGVGFRFWTVRQAERIGLNGTVRNLADGTVEVEAAGTAEQVAALRAALRQGPPGAVVDAVEAADPGAAPLPRSFQIRR